MITEGAMGDQVQRIQALLAETGAYAGKVDSWWGPKTTASVRQLQKSMGVSPTGRWDIATNTRTHEILSTYNPGGPAATTVFPTVDDRELYQ